MMVKQLSFDTRVENIWKVMVRPDDFPPGGGDINFLCHTLDSMVKPTGLSPECSYKYTKKKYYKGN